MNWDLALKIGIPIFCLVLGKYLDLWFQRKPRLISYLGHASVFSLQGENPMTVHTHAVTVKNAGKIPLNNIRLGHHTLPPDHRLNPTVPYEIIAKENAYAEILIPKLVPGEEVTISYLYFPPLVVGQIHAYTKCDECYARIINVLPTPRPPKWMMVTLWSLVFFGAVFVAYILASLGIWIYSIMHG